MDNTKATTSQEKLEQKGTDRRSSGIENNFKLNPFGELLKECVDPEDITRKKNWWSKKCNIPKSPCDYSIDDTLESFLRLKKGRQHGKSHKGKKVKDQRKDKTGSSNRKEDMNERNTAIVKLPQILKKQRELEEFDKSEKIRIAKQDEALGEIDKLLAKLESEERKTKKNSHKKQKTSSKMKDDMYRWNDDTATHTKKPLTYHDSFSDSLDKLLEDFEDNLTGS